MPLSNVFHPRVPLPRRPGLDMAVLWRLLLWACVMALCLPMRNAPAQQAAPAAAAERWAGMSHTVFTHHTQSGLASALSMVQDRQGFVWLGTQSGLVRWDGNRYVKYTADASRSDAIPDSYIMSLHIDSRGRLWAGMSAGGLARYDPARNNFVRYGAGPGGLRDARVTALTNDGADGLWVGTGKGLDHMNAEGAITGRAAPWNKTLPAGGIDALLYDRQGTLWIGTRRGLFKLPASAKTRLQSVPLGDNTDKGKPADDNAPAVNALYQDSSGRIWIGTRTRGAFSLDAGAGSASAVLESSVGNGDLTLHTERVSTIVEAAPGEIWLGTSGGDGGIVVVDTMRGATHRIRHQSDTPDSLADNSIMALFRDNSGIIHVGHMSGMSQHDPLPRAVTTIRHLGAPGQGVGASNSGLSVPSMIETPDGRLWLGMVNGGVNIVDPHLGLRRQLLAGADLPRTQVLAMTSGPGGEVYIGTGQGLYRADKDGSRVRRLTVPQRRDDDEVWALAVVGDTLWLGGLDGVRQLGFKGDDTAAPFALLRHESSSLGDPRVTALLALGADLWVGTRTGLARVAADTVELIPTDLAAPDRLPPGYVSSLMADQQGRLWLSNFGTGIVVLKATGADGRRRFQRLGIFQGLPDNSANLLLLDRQGMIWASTDAGLARIDPHTLAIRAIGPGEGVHVPTYWTNSGVSTRAGELIFGGLSGLTILHPRPLNTWRYVPPVVVTRILLNDKEIPSALYNIEHTSAIGSKRPAAPVTVLPEGRERGFSLEFAALDYSAPERNRYSYRLKGFDSTWVETDANARRASYNNLPPGDYVLQLRGSNRNGDWAPVLEVPVRVLPAWHQRPLARLFMAAAGLLAAAGLIQLRTRYLRRRQRELEAMVEARTAELRATQAQLETLAYGDPLTGLANRRLFNDELRQLAAQAERGTTAFTLLLIDLDHFKQINDTLGHDAGDALLAAVAERLRAALREADRPFRLGGDEFAVLLSHGQAASAPSEQALEALAVLCERILDSLAQPLPHGAAVIQISASIGAALHRHGEDHEQLYKQADLALYQAKAAGRNTWRLAPGR